jgi:uncharacterized protein
MTAAGPLGAPAPVGLQNRPRNHDIAAMTETTTSPHLKKCPICGKLAEQRYRPFCSRRCADVDLNRWLSGVYAVPAVEDEEKPETGEPERE